MKHFSQCRGSFFVGTTLVRLQSVSCNVFLSLMLTSLFQTGLKKTQEDGPVPWASEDDVAFLAEQVSHHPPSKFWLLLTARSS